MLLSLYTFTLKKILLDDTFVYLVFCEYFRMIFLKITTVKSQTWLVLVDLVKQCLKLPRVRKVL